MQPFFSIIVVCLNPGEKLKKTLESIKKQTFRDYEVVIKDGFSKDGSLAYAEQIFSATQKQDKPSTFLNKEEIAGDEKLQPGVYLIQEKDTGIYDAMNQAVCRSKGKYVYFLNCGDWFYSETVLEEMAKFIRESTAYKMETPGIYYGNIFERLTNQQVISNPQIDAFGCYRNVPCHQACFYSRELLAEHPFETKYKVRADYEQFLWCFFEGKKEDKVSFYYINMLISDYEGGGFSETKENRKRSAAEHKEITSKYMGSGQLFKYRAVLFLTLAPLRTYLAENQRTAGVYNKFKEWVYAKKNRH